ncbi:MAG: hypothetical protein EBZ59_12185, partial [Planctomycetia bacterium]|nr:hypothetical protein [Planctomycetia bacterium]
MSAAPPIKPAQYNGADVPPAVKHPNAAMNKAFCREPDSSTPPRCPACGTDGLQVSAETLRAHVRDGLAPSLAEPAHWCPADACTVAYFDLVGRCVATADAHGLPWPKDPHGPLCACHGLSVDDVDRDIAEGTPTRVRAVVQQAGLPGAACGLAAADGRSCVARVQRHYLRRLAEAG